MIKIKRLIILLILTSSLLISCTKEDSPPTKPRGSDNAKPIYNQAYQENFDADNFGEIILNAKNAYVLVDPFQDNIASQIHKIKTNNNEVGGYISIGTGEDWRDDFEEMKPFLVSKQWGQWPGEYFVNNTMGMIPIMKTRIDSMAKWGCDWVEFDNMDWTFDDDYRTEYNIQATQQQGIDYFNELCDYVHQKGMKCMAKNMVDNAYNFDGVLYESYSKEKNWWDNNGTKDFLNAGKLVIINHYNEKNCDEVYLEYMGIYDKNISYICEDFNLKKYVHYNQ